MTNPDPMAEHELRAIVNSFGSDCSFRNLVGDEYKAELDKTVTNLNAYTTNKIIEELDAIDAAYLKSDYDSVFDTINDRIAELRKTL